MKRTSLPASVALALACAGVGAGAAGSPLFAQEFDGPPLRMYGGFWLVSAIPTGELAQVIGSGWGVGGNLALLNGDGTWSLRLDLGFAEYGSETRRVCLSPTVGCRIEVDLETSNSIAYGSLGPQWAVPRGTFRPYVSPAIGLVEFSTTSTVDGAGADSNVIFNTTNFSDTKFSVTGLAGVMISVKEGNTPILLDIGARYHRHGEAEYLTEDDIVDEPDGSITITPNRSEANFFSLNFGASFGIRFF